MDHGVSTTTLVDFVVALTQCSVPLEIVPVPVS
jgi:hypothetical protein